MTHLHPVPAPFPRLTSSSHRQVCDPIVQPCRYFMKLSHEEGASGSRNHPHSLVICCGVAISPFRLRMRSCYGATCSAVWVLMVLHVRFHASALSGRGGNVLRPDRVKPRVADYRSGRESSSESRTAYSGADGQTWDEGLRLGIYS